MSSIDLRPDAGTEFSAFSEKSATEINTYITNMCVKSSCLRSWSHIDNVIPCSAPRPLHAARTLLGTLRRLPLHCSLLGASLSVCTSVSVFLI